MVKKQKKLSSNSNGKIGACLCGCGKAASGDKMFIQGHDMKLRSAIMAHVRDEEKGRFSNAQLKFVLAANWMTSEIKKELPKLRK